MHIVNRRGFLRAAGAATTASAAGVRGSMPCPPWPAKQAARSPPTTAFRSRSSGRAPGPGRYQRRRSRCPASELVAVADCYDGRLIHSKELWGDDLFTTRATVKSLARSDVDAVIIGTPDHWHKQASVDAMNAGKDVLLREAMIHSLLRRAGDDRRRALHGAHSSVGSQRVSSVIYAKAKELLAAGAIGKLTWLPPAGTATRPWARGTTPCRSMLRPRRATAALPGHCAQDSLQREQFFQCASGRPYGTGVAGDLFVHLFSGTHFITGAHGPHARMAPVAALLNDGRDLPT